MGCLRLKRWLENFELDGRRISPQLTIYTSYVTKGLMRHTVRGHLGHLDAVAFPTAFHSRCCVHGVAKQLEATSFPAENTSRHLTTMVLRKHNVSGAT
eukprot:scaffold2324_cov116-Cylindrotheca_fusiformis.AAC.16